MDPSAHDVTVLLKRWNEGDEIALNELTPLVYRELRLLAANYLRRERLDHTLQPTELIHEAYLRLVQQDQEFTSRRHFYGVAAHLMRMILVDHARARAAAKRGGGAERATLNEIEFFSPEQRVDVLALDQALDRLAILDERKSRIIELRFFGGLSLDEIASLLTISVPTVIRDLRMAEAWLYRELA